MRIIEKEELPPAPLHEPANNPIKVAHKSNQIDPPAENAPQAHHEQPKNHRHHSKSTPQRHSCLSFIGCLGLMLVAIFATVAYLVIYVAGPIVKSVDTLPNDFPQNLAIYQLDNAKIKVQNSLDKTKAIKLIRALPGWALNPFVSYLSPEMKTQILASGQTLGATSTLKLVDLERALNNNSKSVSLSWDNIGKNKEELVDYYKKQLKASGFEVKENVSDYEIDLSFLRGGVSGAMTVVDSFTNNNSSLIKMTVNYLSGK